MLLLQQVWLFVHITIVWRDFGDVWWSLLLLNDVLFVVSHEEM